MIDPLPAGFLGGLVLGCAYFRAVRATAALIEGRGRPFFGLALTLGRLALLGVGFYVAVLTSGIALLAALIGVLCARTLMLCRIRGAGS